jgi:hypothetical protein
VEFLKEALALLPDEHTLRVVRVDAGFFDQQLLGFLEQRGWYHVSTTRHAAHPSFPLRCSVRPSRPLLGPAFVRFLGRATAAHPAGGKCLSLRSSNFAEVAFGTLAT